MAKSANVMNAEQLREWARSLIADAYGSQEVFARHSGISTAYVSDFLAGKRDPGDKMLEALGYERVVKYRRKECLGPRK